MARESDDTDEGSILQMPLENDNESLPQGKIFRKMPLSIVVDVNHPSSTKKMRQLDISPKNFAKTRQPHHFVGVMYVRTENTVRTIFIKL